MQASSMSSKRVPEPTPSTFKDSRNALGPGLCTAASPKAPMIGFIINGHDHNSFRQSLGRLVVSAKGPGMGVRDILRGLAAACTPSDTGCLGQQPGMGHKRQGLPDQSRGHFQATQTCPLPSSGSPLPSGGNHIECLMASKVLWETASLLNLVCVVTVFYPRYTHMPLHMLFPLLGHYTHSHTCTRVYMHRYNPRKLTLKSLSSLSLDISF